MSLIPLLLGRLSAAPAPAATSAGRYDPGAGHRPVAAVVAVGLPVALLVAVALSPFEMPIRFSTPGGPIVVEQIPWEKPKVDPDTKKQEEPRDSVITTTQPPFDPVDDSPTEIDRPINPMPEDSGPTTGTGTSTTPTPIPLPPTPVPPFIRAELDPRFERSFQPDYPASEQRREIEGTSKVRVLVGTDGRVKAVQDIATSSEGFFAETKRRAWPA
jgi:periplasmic protein TonB